jgi:uncharacterized membrane protein
VSSHEHHVDVEVPVRSAYDQWTQFEEFPRFMDGVESIEQRSDDRLHWKVDFGGVTREFDTRITEQKPDQRIAWTTTEGQQHAGVVTFHKLNDHSTRVTLQMEYDPQGFIENVGDKAGFVSRRVEGDMKRFKEFIEERVTPTGGWRGEINN